MIVYHSKYMLLSCFGKKVTKEADIGEALTAKPIGTA